MKTILSIIIASVLLSGNLHAQSTLVTQYSLSYLSMPTDRSVDPRVLRAFSITFPSVVNVRWHEEASRYVASFQVGQISAIAMYDTEGTLLKMRRSYSAEFLAPSLLIAIQKKHPAKSIIGITEVTDGGDFICEVTLRDDKYWYKLLIDASSRMEMIEKFKRIEPKY